MLTKKQRLSRIAGSFILGFSSGLTIQFNLFSLQDLVMIFGRSFLAGLITALPQLSKTLNDYGKGR